jgi:hypothetical protein
MRIRALLGVLLAAITLHTQAAIPASEQAQAIEFYHSGLDHYFITANAAEIADLDTGVHPGWTRTGYQFPVIKAGSTLAGSQPVCRFYAGSFSSHFYSAKTSECDAVKAQFGDVWQYESGEVFRAFLVDANGKCPADTTTVTRLWNKRPDVNHRYTDQMAIYQFMTAKGYVPEGDGDPAFPSAFCAPTPGSVVPAPSSAGPNCTVNASSGAPALNTSVTLSATCTNNPTSYLWQGCTSTTSSCTVKETTAGNKTYTLYSSNAQAPAAPVSIKVAWGGTSGTLPICTITPSTATPTTGVPLVLTANCSNAPVQYDWMECNYLLQSVCSIMPACAATSSTCSVNTSNAGYARYSVDGINSVGTGPRVAVDVEWKQGAGGGGGGGGGGGAGGGTPDPIPNCSIFASDSAPLIGTTIVLSASCTGNPTSFSWTGVTNGCAALQCGATSSTAGTQTYSLTASNATGTSAITYMSVNWRASSTTPTCALSASNTQPQTGTTITISASCSNSPTTYVWTGCTSNSPSCTDSVSAAGSKTYSLVASNGSGAGGAATVTVNWTAPVTAPPVCSVSANNTSPTVGQTVTFTASCNGSPTAYVWTNCGGSTSNTCSAIATGAGSQTYYVAGTNQFGTGTAVGVVVNWQPAGTGGGGGGGDFCSAFGNVIGQTIGWGDLSGQRIYTSSMGGFGPTTALVIQFTVPTSPSTYATEGKVSFAEFGDPPTLRQQTISKSRCDFRPVDPTGASGPLSKAEGVQTLTQFNVGAAPLNLTPGQTYYINVRNFSSDIGQTCTGGACNGSITFDWPK